MEEHSLQFQGVNDWALLTIILTAVTAVLAGYAVWLLINRRRRAGVLAVAAALSPAVLIPVLLGDAWIRYRAGDSEGGRNSWVAAVVVMVFVTLASLVVGGAGGSSGAIWLAVLTLQVLLAVGVFYCSVYYQLGRGKLAGLMALRFVAIAALIVVLFKPAYSVVPQGAAKPVLAVLLDRSGSMSTQQADLPSRYDQGLQMLASHRG